MRKPLCVVSAVALLAHALVAGAQYPSKPVFQPE